MSLNNVFAHLIALITLITATCMPLFAHATGSSFAVFKVSYSDTKSEVVGGVAGTAFFISNKTAYTACHVLNAKSFEPNSGMTKAKVWLVHENQKPIEVFKEDITTNCDRDETIINFNKSAVSNKFVFSMASKKDIKLNSEVESEGFLANTSGPTLSWLNGEVVIVNVPHLQRLKSKGFLIRNVQVNLQASDLKLIDTKSIEVSYQPIVGMSGGPVTFNGRILAFNSFADPGTRKTTWAVLVQ